MAKRRDEITGVDDLKRTIIDEWVKIDSDYSLKRMIEVWNGRAKMSVYAQESHFTFGNSFLY